MNLFKKIIFSVGACCVITSCSLIGINLKRKTPSRPGKYPVFTKADSLAGQVSTLRRSFDVSYYELNLDIDVQKKYIAGFSKIYFTALENIDTLQIDLYKNLRIDKIEFNSQVLRFERKDNTVFVFFPQEINKGKKEIISVYYQGKPKTSRKPPWEGGFVWKEDKNNNPWIGVTCELEGAGLWWPVKGHMYDEPDSLKMQVSVPMGLFCVSNGKLVEHSTADQKETFIWKTNYPINTYNATIYIGKYEHFTLPYQRDSIKRELDFYVLPYNLERAKVHFGQAADIIKFYENTFGEYPWWKEGYKLVESPYEGMEHQTAIAYGNGYKNEAGQDFDYIILHETAHEWWGNSITAPDVSEIWLHEGLATYSEALYVEKTKGYDAYLNYLNFYSILIKNKRPVIGPNGVNYWSYKDGDPYMKGALLLHTLRNIIARDSVFFDIIRSFYNENKYSIATTKKFIDLVNLKTGRDFNFFFKQYLYSRVCPVLVWNYYFNPLENSYEFSYRWDNVDADFNCPVTVKAGEETITVFPSQMVKTIKVSGENIFINTNNSYFAIKKNKGLGRKYDFD